MKITKEKAGKTHNLKIWPEYFAAVRDGLKRAELRCNDRDYQADDTLDLCEWDPNEEAFTCEYISVTVTHVADIGQWMPGYVLLSIAAPQPLTTSERAELENYRTAQQVVPGDIDARMKSAGMLSAAEIISGQPIDAFVKHAGVVDMGSLLQWSEMRRAEFLRMQSRYELGDKEKDDLYEWVVSHVAVFSELHVNIRAAMQSGAVKDGWVMVPVEPTKEMVDSLRSAITPGFALPYLVAGYKTMIAEAPKYEDSK